MKRRKRFFFQRMSCLFLKKKAGFFGDPRCKSPNLPPPPPPALLSYNRFTACYIMPAMPNA